MNLKYTSKFSFTIVFLVAIIFSACSPRQYPMYHKESNRTLSFSLKRHAKTNNTQTTTAPTSGSKFTKNNKTESSLKETPTSAKAIAHTSPTDFIASTTASPGKITHLTSQARTDSPSVTQRQGHTRTAVKQAIKKVKHQRADVEIDSNTLWTAAAIVLLIFLALIILSNLGAFIYLLLVVVLVLVLLALLGYRV